MKILLFLHTFSDVLRFGGTLEKFEGTPVENTDVDHGYKIKYRALM